MERGKEDRRLERSARGPAELLSILESMIVEKEVN
jgi:hypothetical protein